MDVSVYEFSAPLPKTTLLELRSWSILVHFIQTLEKNTNERFNIDRNPIGNLIVHFLRFRIMTALIMCTDEFKSMGEENGEIAAANSNIVLARLPEAGREKFDQMDGETMQLLFQCVRDGASDSFSPEIFKYIRMP
jgi:hypothetical protein